MTGTPPKVFISYSHDTVEHQDRVLAFADRLRTDGIDAEIDQYNPAPLEGWALWCERQIEDADFVLMVCTEPYRRRVSGDEEQGKGLGVVWEAQIIRQLLYDAGAISGKFIPVLFSDNPPEEIPTPIKGYARYVVDTENGYEELYRCLTGQPRLPRPPLGKIRPLPPRPRQWREGAIPAPVPPSPIPDPKPKRWLVLAVAVVPVLGILALFFLRGIISWDGKREYVSAILYIIFTENPPPRVTPGRISYLANKDPRSTELEKELANRFLVDTGVTVSVDPQLADPISYPQKVKEYDLVILDAVSVGELSNSLSKLVHSDSAIQDWPFLTGNSISVPLWNDDVGLLYYRKDLVGDPPQTWEELEQEAFKIQEEQERKSNRNFIGFAWQGDAYEGLTCNALEWVASSDAVKENGTIDYDSEAFFNAISRARGWVKGQNGHDPISAPALGFKEKESLDAFKDGKAAFLRSWPSKYVELKNGMKDKLGVARLPRNVGVLGGVALVVPQSSKNKVDALRFIEYIRSEEVRQWRASAAGDGPPPSELNGILSKTKAIIRPSDEADYVKKSKCFSQAIKNAIDTEGDFQEKVKAIAQCRLTKVTLQLTGRP